MDNQNLGINLKKIQYFHNKSLIPFQNYYKPLPTELLLSLVLRKNPENIVSLIVGWRTNVGSSVNHRN